MLTVQGRGTCLIRLATAALEGAGASPISPPIVSPESSALVISVAQWGHLKRAAGRAKDLEHLDRYLDDR